MSFIAFGFLGRAIGRAGAELAGVDPSSALALRLRDLVWLLRAVPAGPAVIGFVMTVKPATKTRGTVVLADFWHELCIFVHLAASIVWIGGACAIHFETRVEHCAGHVGVGEEFAGACREFRIDERELGTDDEVVAHTGVHRRVAHC